MSASRKKERRHHKTKSDHRRKRKSDQESEEWVESSAAVKCAREEWMKPLPTVPTPVQVASHPKSHSSVSILVGLT
jgi:hypothetical protein